MPEKNFLKPISREGFFKRGLTKKSREILGGRTTLKKEAGRFLIGSAITAGAVLTATNPALALAGARRVGRFIMPKTIKGAIGLTLGAPVAYGILKSSPKARKTITSVFNPRKNIKKGNIDRKSVV